MNNEVWAERNFKAQRSDPWKGVPIKGQKRRSLVKFWDVVGALMLVLVLFALAYMPDAAMVATSY
jgi:hypothetical protein